MISLSGDEAVEDEPVFRDKKETRAHATITFTAWCQLKIIIDHGASLSEYIIFSCKPSAASSPGQRTLSLCEEEAWNRATSG